MGSDIGKLRNERNDGYIRFLVPVLFGFFLSTILQRAFSLFGIANECTISYGGLKYKGPQYSSTVTVGDPKCLIESKFLKVQQHRVRLEGKTGVIDDWLWIDYHDRVNVLVEIPTFNDSSEPHFLIFEQTKYALEDRISLAIVGGIIEPGEEAKTAATREVLEETGYQCNNLHFLGRYRTDVNRGMGWTNSFVASKCKRQNSSHSKLVDEVGVADTERQDVKVMSLTEVRQAAIAGKFMEIQWSATVALAILHYMENKD